MKIQDMSTTHRVYSFDMRYRWSMNLIFSLIPIGIFIWLWSTTQFEFDPDGISLAIGILIWSLWIASEIFRPSLITTFEKESNLITQHKKWLWREETTTHPLTEVIAVHLSRKRGIGKARRYFRLILELHSGEHIPLSWAFWTKPTVEAWAKGLRSFLGLKVNEIELEPRELIKIIN